MNTQPLHVETIPNHEISHENWSCCQILPSNLCLYGLKFDMLRLDTYNEVMGGFLDSNVSQKNNLKIKQQAYRIINVNGTNVDFFFNLCSYGLKFDVLGQHTCIDSMGGKNLIFTLGMGESIW